MLIDNSHSNKPITPGHEKWSLTSRTWSSSPCFGAGWLPAHNKGTFLCLLTILSTTERPQPVIGNPKEWNQPIWTNLGIDFCPVIAGKKWPQSHSGIREQGHGKGASLWVCAPGPSFCSHGKRQCSRKPYADPWFLVRTKEMSLHAGTQTQDRHVIGLEICSPTILREKWVPVSRHPVQTSVTAKG